MNGVKGLLPRSEGGNLIGTERALGFKPLLMFFSNVGFIVPKF